MAIIDTFSQIEKLSLKRTFNMEGWKEYIHSFNPFLERILSDDFDHTVSTGRVTFEKHFLPVLNVALGNPAKRKKAHDSFLIAIGRLEEAKKRSIVLPDVDIIFYLGLCNGAGWVTEVQGRTTILVGIEKIIELEWFDLPHMQGLIYHEMGHAYQKQFGVLERLFERPRQKFLWQLFTEGIAMHFEQTLVGDKAFFHQDQNGWKAWCDEHFLQIRDDFAGALDDMTFENQGFFGDWVKYQGWSDVGYYLGGKFVDFLLRSAKFDDVIRYDIETVSTLFNQFVQ